LTLPDIWVNSLRCGVMEPFPTLRTNRLLLREFSPEDAPDVRRLACAREVARTTRPIPHPYPEGAAERWISTHRARFEAGEALHFAVETRVRYAFEDLGLHRLYAAHFGSNPASGKVMRKIGMSYEGTLREHHKKWGEYEDRVEYGLLARDWRASGVERRRIYPLRG
jgi:ribosomal-protein-alanine N-acetyltransferase